MRSSDKICKKSIPKTKQSSDNCPPPPFNYGPYIGNLALSSDQHMPAAATVPFSLQYTENLEFGSKIFQGTHSPLNTTVITFNSWHCLHRIVSEIFTYFVFRNRPRDIYSWFHNAATSWQSHKFKAQLCCVWKTSCNNQAIHLVAGTTTQPLCENRGLSLLITDLLKGQQWRWIKHCSHMRRCRMNRNKRCQNSFVCFSNEKVIFVFVGLQYDSMKPNHAKKVKK